MAFTILPAFPLILVGTVFIIAVVVALKSQKKTRPLQRYQSSGRQVYVPGEFSEQMELDLRLPYRRFRQIYPHSNLTYDAYKKLQMQRAFRRSMSSKDNKRMVR
ncbi:MAG: hypothetical protein NWE94_02235 [Candidatus Bathyarchaeota archaeon]|nr:hypothetical protein [Candidatus Bathyarchaeota archaeon]